MKVICRVPIRINLANGGDTDYYLKEIGWGCVVNATLSSHFYEVELNDKQDSRLEIVDYFDYLNNMNRSYHLESEFSELELLKATFKKLIFNGKNSFALRTNVPMQSGLGGSSSLAVALIGAIKHYKKAEINPEEVASIAYELERFDLNIHGGYQDQYAAAFGRGLNYMEFKQDSVKVENLKLPEETIKKLEKNILLYYLSKRKVTGTEVHNTQEETVKKNPETIKKLLIEKRNNAIKIKESLLNNKLEDFGKLLRIDGELKNKLSSKVSNSYTDSIMKTALDNGALGGKVSGAGSGGCMFFYVPDENINKVRKAMYSTGAIEMNFRFQRSFEPGILIREIK